MAKKNRELIKDLKQAISRLEASESLLRALDQDAVVEDGDARERLESVAAQMLDRTFTSLAHVHEELLRRKKPDDSCVVWNIILPTRELAKKVLDGMLDLINGPGKVSVSDYYQLAGISGRYSDEKYGWFDLTKVEVRRVREGYSLDLPRPVKFDN